MPTRNHYRKTWLVTGGAGFIGSHLCDRLLEAGDGVQTRSFCYVDALVKGLIHLINTCSETTGPIDLGIPGECTMRELTKRKLDDIGTTSSLANTALPVDGAQQRQPDIHLAGQQLGSTLNVTPADGLKPTICYFQGLVESGPA